VLNKAVIKVLLAIKHLVAKIITRAILEKATEAFVKSTL
jgi:hypothetical protein